MYVYTKGVFEHVSRGGVDPPNCTAFSGVRGKHSWIQLGIVISQQLSM